MSRLRLALTLSGAVSLGAYEGGALAALLVALGRMREDDPDAVVVDAIAGASAGSMTGVLAARALLSQDDPVRLMHQAWVETPSLEHLQGHGPGAPLTVERVVADAQALLRGSCAPVPGTEAAPAQQTPVRLRLALGALRGLDYTFRRLDGADLNATTYLDWFDVTLAPGCGDDAFLAALTPAMASGAHAAAFSPQFLVRGAQRDAYVANGVVNFPESGGLWYTDGGTVDNQPLGRALDLTGELDDDLGDEHRLHILVIPDPSFPLEPADASWADPDDPPAWVWTLPQAAKMAVAQSLYDDMTTAEKTNSRLRWVAELVDCLTPLISDDSRQGLSEFIVEMDRTRAQDLGASSTHPPPAPAASEDVRDLLTRAIHSATGLHGKQPVAIAAISPRLMAAADRQQLGHELAGEFLGHFGGFLDLKARESDFALGYHSALVWMKDPRRGFQYHGVERELADAATAAASERSPAAPSAGDVDLGELGFRVWAQLAHLVGRAVHLAESGLRAKTGRGDR
jgi:Patatin-like phospholipase